ncbi:hypothetical protein [Roseimicrobium sp. ORNL1]|uniref:hypothetical protein n=1 Tax=Roseimicrobium sp. ORNL1 TaxID=2711231 RepID=UPI0013E11058|nr:hypothetical protein [Roseimicrobium sp. ORNL1]QIF01961.1 hypothetical protein G5S37_10610 [Roseimicrobium sp. ORNL1]
MAFTLEGGAMAQADSNAAAGKTAATEAEPWIEVPATIIEAFQLRNIRTDVLNGEPCWPHGPNEIRRLLGVDAQVAWVMHSMLEGYLRDWAQRCYSVDPTEPGYKWELRIHPKQHAEILATLRSRAEAFLTPPQRELFDVLCMIEVRDLLNMSSILVQDEGAITPVQMRPGSSRMHLHYQGVNSHSLAAQLRDIAKQETRPAPKDNPAPIDPANLYTLGQSQRMPVSVVQRYRWNWDWGFILDGFALPPLPNSLLTPEQSKTLHIGMNSLLTKFRAHERSVAKYETRTDGALVITVAPGPPATVQAHLQDVRDVLNETLGERTVPNYLLEPCITREVRLKFPYLKGESKQLTHVVKDGVMSFETKIGSTSFAPIINHVPVTEHHLLKDTAAAAEQQKKK